MAKIARARQNRNLAMAPQKAAYSEVIMRDLPFTPATGDATKYIITETRYDEFWQAGKWRVGFCRANGRGVWQAPSGDSGRFQVLGKVVLDLRELPEQVQQILVANGLAN